VIESPGFAAVVDDPLAQQQFRQPVPRRHQIAPHIVSSPDQVPRRFLLHPRHSDRDDLPEVQQPGQMSGVAAVGLDPVPGRALQLRRRRHLAVDAFPGQEPGQAESCRSGLIDHRDRAGQRPPSRAGDRRLNCCLHTMAITQIQRDCPGRAC
jgi:hypothetical protein